jgi:hypothetical protein
MNYLPCPHCGGPRVPQEYGVTETTSIGWYMTCFTKGCNATGPLATTRREAIDKDSVRIPWPPKAAADA